MTFRIHPAPLLATVILLVTLGVPYARAQRPAPADARGLAESIVRDNGLQTGYDEEAGTIVAIGVTTREIANPATDRRFMGLRESAAKSALLKAKAKVMKIISSDIRSFDQGDLKLLDGTTISSTTSFLEDFSRLTLFGFQTICTAESWNDGVYQMAVAVGWSTRSEKESRKALRPRSPGTAAVVPAKASAEWAVWAKEVDFASMVGARSFLDSNGKRRYAGIGFADIEGKTGTGLLMAKRLARTQATQNLVYGLYSDAAAKTISAQMLSTVSKGEEDETRTLKALEHRLTQRCRSIRVFDREVYATTATHPISGHRIFISVAGIEPEQLGDMGLLKDQTPSSPPF